MRLLTRSDFDGLACGILLKELDIIDNWKFVHPKDIQDGLIEATDNDVLANIPYIPGCKLWFDHHVSENERLGDIKYEGESRRAPSCARIIYEYYGGEETLGKFAEMIEKVDRVDSGNLTREEILYPSGWILLGFMMDPRTGLGRFRDFKISNYELMEMLMDKCRVMSIDEVLMIPDLQERIEMYEEQTELFIKMIAEHSKVHKNCILTDLRDLNPIYTGNRFIVYCLFPEQNISLWVVDGKAKQNCSIAVGHSILNRTSKTKVGSLLLKYGGGGHDMVGTCQVDYDKCDQTIQELIAQINIDG